MRVWQSTQDAARLFISARPEGERWGDTTELDMSGLNSRHTLRYGDITVAVPLGSGDEPDVPTEADTDGSRPCTWLISMEQYVDGFTVKSCETSTFVPGSKIDVAPLYPRGRREAAVLSCGAMRMIAPISEGAARPNFAGRHPRRGDSGPGAGRWPLSPMTPALSGLAVPPPRGSFSTDAFPCHISRWITLLT